MAQYGTTEYYLEQARVKDTAYQLALEGLRQRGRQMDAVDGIHAEAVAELKRQSEIAHEEYQKAAEKERKECDQKRNELDAKRTVGLLKELAGKIGKTVEELIGGEG